MKDKQMKQVGLMKQVVRIACRLPLAACRLPLAACRLPLAAGHDFLAARGLTMASGFLTMRGAARRGFALFAFAIFGALTLSFALADDAAAQQSPSVTYAAYPADLVSVTAEGALVVLQQPETGVMTATIVGTSFIFVDGGYVRNPAFTPGERYMTLRFISSCSVKDGCDIFGLNSSDDINARIAAFRAMDITTMRQFAASGADVNERPVSDNIASGSLLYILADVTVPEGEAHPNLAKMSVLVNAGANVNYQDPNGNTMLHYTASIPHITGALLAMPGISVNIIDNAGNTPLDEIGVLPPFFIVPVQEETARLLREAGGECRIATNTDICGE